MDHDHRDGESDGRTGVREARQRLLEEVTPLDRTERVGLTSADGRILAEVVTAPRPVPHYERAAMDGYAVRAADVSDASDRSPERLRLRDEIVAGAAVPVDTGSEFPEGADTVVRREKARRETDDELAVVEGVPKGKDVAPVGEDVAAGQHLYDPGHRLRPSDLGLLKSVGLSRVTVYERPRVSVIPTGEELVQSDPAPGEVIETNGQTVTRYIRRWGGKPTYREIVPDDRDALREAIRRDADHDLVVTTGGSSVGDRDVVPDVVDSLGEVFVHGVALKPGHPVAFGQVDDTPVLMLPGYPVACIVNAVQFLRSALARAGHATAGELPVVEATLAREIGSEPGTRSFVRVELDADGDGLTATPTEASGAGVLSSVALADGWIVVPEECEGIDSGAAVSVENWEPSL